MLGREKVWDIGDFIIGFVENLENQPNVLIVGELTFDLVIFNGLIPTVSTVVF